MKKKTIRRIGILTGGGDCPGLNAAIRAVTKTAMHDYDLEVIGIQDGFHGLIFDKVRPLRREDVSGILILGGTILGASNKDNPLSQPFKIDGKIVKKDCTNEVLQTLNKHEIDALVTVGGDGTQNIAHALSKKGVNVVGIPKTIDNDLEATDFTIGFHTAVMTATEAIDKLHTTAMAHQRIIVVEVMGRYAGWLTLYSGVAGGGDVILIPEIPYDFKEVCSVLKARSEQGKRFSIVVVSEGAKEKGGKMVVRGMDHKRTDPVQLGGVGNYLANRIEEKTGLETRVSVLGHLVRGGRTTPEDRLLATQFGKLAVDLIVQGKMGECVVTKNGKITHVPLTEAVKDQKLVQQNHPLIESAKSVGTSFGVK